MSKKKEVRANFRNSVFTRAKYRCECCGTSGFDRQDKTGKGVPLDAHHINNRMLFDNGGYVKENGISVCDECHLKSEQYWCDCIGLPGFMPDDLYKIIGSSEVEAIAADAKQS
jgi:predicted restriction endonuclease